MRFKLFPILFLLLMQNIDGQVFSIQPGQMFYHSKTITPVFSQIKQRDNKNYFSFNFNYFVLEDKFQIGFSYSFFSGWTRFNVGTTRWRGNGSSSTNISRFALIGGYNVLDQERRVKIMPQIRIVFERAKATAGYSERAYIDSRTDDHYEGPISLLPLNSFQVLPALGLDLDWNFWWRLHFVYSTYYAWGHKPFQKYYFEYTYDGVPQPTAEWHSDGTGWFFSVGLGMTMFGHQKVKAEREIKKGKRRKKRRR